MTQSAGGLRVDPREAFLLAEEGQYIENSGRGRLPGKRRAQRLRAALTGQTTSPGIFDVLALLGKAESLARIDAQAAG